ncbi:hypothetical protein [Variovorax sp. LjRoot175]|uniref:hypothetical protein n=1 Tax=Variovorax sp. LjRoot175 TaxID=3342276 RepID=UPI003F51A88D
MRSQNKPGLSSIDGASELASYWPRALAHLGDPYDNGGSPWVVIGEYSTLPCRESKGARVVSVALVPEARAVELVQGTAATGWKVDSHGPRPIVDPGEVHNAGFWIEGEGRDERFEPLVNAWSADNREVIMPDNNLLMVYGLVPRHLDGGIVCWDDPYGPVYDVLRVRSAVDLGTWAKAEVRAFVEIRREYLSDYCSLKGCSAVAFYFEERWSDGDESILTALGSESSRDFHLPGRLLNMQRHSGGRTPSGLFAQAWGRTIVLRTGERDVSAAPEPTLAWPGHSGIMTIQRAAADWLYGYVSDEVLLDYQSRPEFDIYPESGAVSYRGQWAVTNTDRIGRNFIRVELKKLYEGCPSGVIANWHRYAVDQATAEADRDAFGTANIGTRAHDLVDGYLAMTTALEAAGDRLSLTFSQGDIGRYTGAEVKYRCWWGTPGLTELGLTAPLSASQDDFLSRCVLLQKLVEALQPAPLRNMVLAVGIPKSDAKAFASLKLLGTLCQVATLAKEGGHEWPGDADAVIAQWDSTRRIPAMATLFALGQLRNLDAHRSDRGISDKMQPQCEVFSIDVKAHAAGWGLAIDRLYDGLANDFRRIAELLSPDS